MSTGFNSNVEFEGTVYHVQTEDRGLQHPFVDTVVLSGGRVVYRRSVGYQDLLTADPGGRGRVGRPHRATTSGDHRRRPRRLAPARGTSTAAAIAAETLQSHVLACRRAGLHRSRGPLASRAATACRRGRAGIHRWGRRRGRTVVNSASQTDRRRPRQAALPHASGCGSPAKSRLWSFVRVPPEAQDHLRYRLKPKPREPEPASQ